MRLGSWWQGTDSLVWVDSFSFKFKLPHGERSLFQAGQLSFVILCVYSEKVSWVGVDEALAFASMGP